MEGKWLGAQAQSSMHLPPWSLVGVCGPSPALVSVGDLQNALGGLHIEAELGRPQGTAGDGAG